MPSNLIMMGVQLRDFPFFHFAFCLNRAEGVFLFSLFMGKEARSIAEADTGERGFDELSEDVVEEMLSCVPFQGSVAASVVDKHPWFFLVGLNHFLPVKNQAFGFDPESNSFCRFPAFRMPLLDHGSLTGTQGLLFALTGSGICKLGYTRCLINNSSWKETPPLLFSRRSPIVGMVPDKPSWIVGNEDSHTSYRILVAGGKALSNQLVVEI